MFKTILYPTDFSEISDKALKYIKQLKEGGAESVIVLHIIDQRTINAMTHYQEEIARKLEVDLNVQAEKDLKKIEDRLKEFGLNVKTVLRTGFPIREILQAEKENDVSVIVIGSHGKSNLEEMFLGSVSEKVVRKCQKPVLVIKRYGMHN